MEQEVKINLFTKYERYNAAPMLMLIPNQEKVNAGLQAFVISKKTFSGVLIVLPPWPSVLTLSTATHWRTVKYLRRIRRRLILARKRLWLWLMKGRKWRGELCNVIELSIAVERIGIMWRYGSWRYLVLKCGSTSCSKTLRSNLESDNDRNVILPVR